jgi:hypothetical protein
MILVPWTFHVLSFNSLLELRAADPLSKFGVEQGDLPPDAATFARTAL